MSTYDLQTWANRLMDAVADKAVNAIKSSSMFAEGRAYGEEDALAKTVERLVRDSLTQFYNMYEPREAIAKRARELMEQDLIFSGLRDKLESCVSKAVRQAMQETKK